MSYKCGIKELTSVTEDYLLAHNWLVYKNCFQLIKKSEFQYFYSIQI